MIAALLLTLLAQQPPALAPVQTPAPAPAVQTGAPEPAKIQPWQGTLTAGRTELQKLSNAGEHDRAVALGARLLAMTTWNELPEDARADTLFDLGVALGAAKAVEPAAEVFHKARGLAGSKPLGLDALYDAGTFRLQGAEELRQQIPEIRQKLGLQPLPPAAQPNAPAQPQGQAAEQADPLAAARAAYLAARTDLVERLRCEASDRDTRANLELIQRRLRELDELQKKREEEQKKQEQQNQDDKSDEQKKQDQQDQKNDQQDPKQDQDQQKQDQQQQDQDKQDQQQPKPDESKPDDQEQKAKPDPKDQQELQPLSPEEVVRLLDQLQKIEEQAEQVRAAMRERRRVPVKKDW